MTLEAWLTYEGFLTQKLKDQTGDARLTLLDQSWLLASLWDRQTLGCSDERVLHRDILMSSWGQPCWFARTILPQSTYDAHVTLFDRLKNETLGQLIFFGTEIQRISMRRYRVETSVQEYAWLTPLMHGGETTLWARLSCFQVCQGPLFYLIEILLPGLMFSS